MYILPRQYECQKCGFECKYGPHDSHAVFIVSGDPICPKCYEELCPKCYEEFLRAHCGVMVPKADRP